MKLDYQINQMELIKDKANKAKNGISKQMVATQAMSKPTASNGQASIANTTDGFGRTS